MLDKQPDRYKDICLEIPEKKNSTKNWLKSGLFFGLFMYVSMIIIFPMIKEEEITQRNLLVGFPFWLVGGLGWGYVMKKWMNKRGKENKSHYKL